MTMSEEHEVKLLSLVDVLEPLSEEELEEVSTRCPSFSLEAGQEFYESREYDGGVRRRERGR
jgi:hypothetical protein